MRSALGGGPHTYLGMDLGEELPDEGWLKQTAARQEGAASLTSGD